MKTFKKILLFAVAPFLVAASALGVLISSLVSSKTQTEQAPVGEHYFNWAEAVASGFSSVDENGEYVLANGEKVLIDLGAGDSASSDFVTLSGATAGEQSREGLSRSRLSSTSIGEGEQAEKVFSQLLSAELKNGELNINVISASNVESHITATADAKFTLGDMVTGGKIVEIDGAKIKTSKGVNSLSALSSTDAKVAVINKGTVTFKNATYGSSSADTAARAFYIDSLSGIPELKLENVNIYRFSLNGSGGAICANGGNIYLYGTTLISGCKSTGNQGGAIFMSTNQAAYNAGATQQQVFMYGAAKIESCSAAANGGAIYGTWNYVQHGVYLGYSNNSTQANWTGRIYGCTSNGGKGGGVYVSGRFYMSSGAVINNVAKGSSAQGGGIWSEHGVMGISGGTISRNSTQDSNGNIAGNGGGIYIYNAGNYAKTLSGGTISENEAGYGAGLFNANTSNTVTLSGTTISENTATTYGGGVYNAGNFTMSGGTIGGSETANSAVSGGGIYNTGTLTINNANANITYNTATSSVSGTNTYGGGIFSSGTLNMSAGTVAYNTAGSYGGGVRSAGTTNISGGNINNNSASYGGGVHHATGVLTISGGNIFKNSATFGGGVGCHSGSISVTGGTIGDSSKTTAAASTSADTRSNYASSYGGGIMIEGSVTLSVSGGTVAYNYAGVNGGGIYNHTSGTVNVSGSAVIKYNGASTSGGGIFSGYNSSSYTAHKVNISGGSILGNVAVSGNGGGVLNNYGTITMSGGTISQNTATGNGGGVHNNTGTFNMTGGTIGGTTAAAANVAANGGGVYNTGTFSFTGGVIGRDGVQYASSASNYGNKATNLGGGIYNSGTLTIGSESSTNYAKVYYNYGHTNNNTGTAGGGGLYTTTGFTFSGYGSIGYNYSIGWGGGFVQMGGSSTFESANTSVTTNIAYWGGGIAISGSGTTLTLKNGTFSGNSGTQRGVIFAFSGATLNLDGATLPTTTVTNNATFNYTSGSATYIYANSGANSVWGGNTYNINGATGANLGYLDIPDFSKCTVNINTNLTSALKIVNSGIATYTGVVATYGSSTTPNSSQSSNIKLCSSSSQTDNLAGTYAGISSKSVYSYHKVTINANGGTNSGNSYYEGVYQASITLPTVTRPGYTFTGWTISGGTGQGTVSGSTFTNGSIASTATAGWSVNHHDIELQAPNGEINLFDGAASYSAGTWVTTKQLAYDTAYQISNLEMTNGDQYYSATRLGYTLTGWKISGQDFVSTYAKYGSSESNCTNALTTNTVIPSSYYIKNFFTDDQGGQGGLELTAQWTGNTYNITYTLNSGTHVSGFATTYTVGGSQQTKNVTYCTRVGYHYTSATITTNTSGSTSSLSGGTTSNGTLTIPANAYGNITIKFTPTANTHDIELLTPNGEISLIDRSGYSYSYGTSATTKPLSYDTAYRIDYLTMTNGDMFNNATRTGYTCSGWKISGQDFVSTYAKYGSSSSSCTSSLTTSTVIPTTYYIKNFFTDDQGGQGGIELTAQWTANKYSITLNVNGGSGTTQTNYGGANAYSYGTTYTLPTASTLGFSYSDATFAGWATSSTSTSIYKTDGASFSNLTSTNGGTVTLYAVYKKTIHFYYAQSASSSATVTINGSTVSKTSGSYTTLTAYHKKAGLAVTTSYAGGYYFYYKMNAAGTTLTGIVTSTTYTINNTTSFDDLENGQYFSLTGNGSGTPIIVTVKSNNSSYGKVRQGGGTAAASFTRSVPFGLKVSSVLNTQNTNWYTQSWSTYIDAYAVATTSTSTYNYSFNCWTEGSGGVVDRHIMKSFILTANFTRSTVSCVTPDTDVLVDFNGTTKKARELTFNDKIVAYNSNTGKYVLTTVKMKYSALNADNTNRIWFEDGTHLDITSSHKLFTESGYRSVDDGLMVGDVVVARGTNKRIVSIELLANQEVVYNFLPKVGDGFVAGGVVIQREDPNTTYVFSTNSPTIEIVKETAGELRLGDTDGVMNLVSENSEDIPNQDVWLDDKFRLLAEGKGELEVDFEGIHIGD